MTSEQMMEAANVLAPGRVHADMSPEEVRRVAVSSVLGCWEACGKTNRAIERMFNHLVQTRLGGES